ncbi:hypothetical protein C7T94_07520 [Pedobacter yulinensis]|uniref:Uncharacterized protein n=1 Tax=Pedobacter yulinensis TaxID=2126353 RepID=A0A2T3HJA2_9SPHI|nr:hypothetical protein [Pedobacter yulinensis]PST82517.1 hypothetical protein C7T94_07520 [Pedobacter yulinensis]
MNKEQQPIDPAGKDNAEENHINEPAQTGNDASGTGVEEAPNDQQQREDDEEKTIRESVR